MGDWINIQAAYVFFLNCQDEYGKGWGECPTDDEAGAWCAGNPL